MGNVNMEARQIHYRGQGGGSVQSKLQELADAIDSMPTFTSNDRDFLDEWESKLPELPADPLTDGVKVLTATTESGETVKSWEEPETGGINYSTTEQKTGDKWIDGKDIYALVVSLETPISVNSGQWGATPLSGANISTIIKVIAKSDQAVMGGIGGTISDGYVNLMNNSSSAMTIKMFVIYYTKNNHIMR